MVCLFLFEAFPVISQEFRFTPLARSAYDKLLSLDPQGARELLGTPSTPTETYVVALSEAVELILTEDAKKFSAWESSFEKRSDRKSSSADDLFLKADMNLHWVFVYLRFGHEFDAALHLRKAHQLTRELRKKYPRYKPIQKTSGLLNVMIGSVPDKYQWVLDVLDMKGDVNTGLKELESLQNTDHDLAAETKLWHAFIHGFILQKPAVGLAELDSTIASGNMAAMFLGANLHLKNSGSEKALELILKMQGDIPVEDFPYLSYLKGEMLLHKGEYARSIQSYADFIAHHHGQSYLKDAHYKTGVCYWIMGETGKAKTEFESAREIGKDLSEADKYASKALQLSHPPPVPLIQLRYFTDGGYYRQANSLITSMDVANFSPDEQVEFAYRRARLYHKINDLSKAIIFYKTTIEKNGDAELYFAPNACLQLGYIAVQEGRIAEAKDFFNKALSYRKHEYKNSIDSKARSALAQLRELK